MMADLPIYNCHIHTFTIRHAPRHFLKLVFGPVLGPLASWALRWKPLARLILQIAAWLNPFQHNDLIERQARFVARGSSTSQQDILEAIQKQYPLDTNFIILPMDMAYMKLGRVEEPLETQHQELLALAAASGGRVIPFFAVDPRRDGIVDQVRQWVMPDKFRGVKIYPNLGYPPDAETLLEVYALCEQRKVPVMAHCTPGGVWEYGLKEADRIRLGHPCNYEPILKRFPRLRLCLAHFGGSEEWLKHLKTPREDAEDPWVKCIADMIRSGQYPGLYTDISYTIFAPRPRELYFDYFDYLKVLLADPHLRERVLFGSDYYMVERESLTEKEVSIVLRSRLGEDLYFQIAHHNPKSYLGIP